MTTTDTSTVRFPRPTSRSRIRNDEQELSFECFSCGDWMDFEDEVEVVELAIKHAVGGTWTDEVQAAARHMIRLGGIHAGLRIYAEQPPCSEEPPRWHAD